MEKPPSSYSDSAVEKIQSTNAYKNNDYPNEKQFRRTMAQAWAVIMGTKKKTYLHMPAKDKKIEKRSAKADF